MVLNTQANVFLTAIYFQTLSLNSFYIFLSFSVLSLTMMPQSMQDSLSRLFQVPSRTAG